MCLTKEKLSQLEMSKKKKYAQLFKAALQLNYLPESVTHSFQVTIISCNLLLLKFTNAIYFAAFCVYHGLQKQGVLTLSCAQRCVSLEVFVACNKFRNLSTQHWRSKVLEGRRRKRERKNRELRMYLFSFYSCTLSVY